MREIDHLKDPGVDVSVNLKCIFKKWDVGPWPGFIWLRIATGSGLL
jgi:hypothetical protein